MYKWSRTNNTTEDIGCRNVILIKMNIVMLEIFIFRTTTIEHLKI